MQQQVCVRTVVLQHHVYSRQALETELEKAVELCSLLLVPTKLGHLRHTLRLVRCD